MEEWVPGRSAMDHISLIDEPVATSFCRLANCRVAQAASVGDVMYKKETKDETAERHVAGCCNI